MEEHQTPPMKPPNGEFVTNGDLYKALFDIDQRLADRDTVFMTSLHGIRADLSAHTSDGHPYAESAAIVREEIKLDAKKAGVMTAALALCAAVIGLIVRLLRIGV